MPPPAPQQVHANPVAVAVWVRVWCCWVLSLCKPAPAAENSHSPLSLVLCLTELEKCKKNEQFQRGGLSQTLCPKGFLGPNSVDTGTWGEESSGFTLKIHFIAQNRTH